MKKSIAYFSMEIGLKNDLPTYSGGLGILAGDTLKSAADLSLPVVAVSLLYHEGYFHQTIDAKGQQQDSPVRWNLEDLLKPTPYQIEVTLEGKPVALRVWRYDLTGASGHVVPVYFFDAKLSDNSPYHQTLTDCLYGKDERYRLLQEAVLGLAGAKLLKELATERGKSIDEFFSKFHLNEGHAALLPIGILAEKIDARGNETVAVVGDWEWLRSASVFTTHTPVAAGHDQFPKSLAAEILPSRIQNILLNQNLFVNDVLNMTSLAMSCSSTINGVAHKHAEVSRKLLRDENIFPITNGVHAQTWVGPRMASLFDKYLTGWERDNDCLRYAVTIPPEEIAAAHKLAKDDLIQHIQDRCKVRWEQGVFTIGFARRAATYKRADLLFSDIEALKRITKKFGKLQLVFAGKAHPRDEGGKDLIRKVVQETERMREINVSLVYLENYQMDLGRLITSGVDLWLNNPIRPLEASGTSGMKAALNGVPSLSTYDGWWVEGCVPGVTGWTIEDEEYCAETGVTTANLPKNRERASRNLYAMLAEKVLPLYYEDQKGYLDVMRHCIALNGSYFNTQRMVQQYLLLAYQNPTIEKYTTY